MSENNRNIDELFRQELGNATEAPPSSVWDTLEQRLEQAAPPKRSMRNPYRLLVLALVLAVIIAAFLLLRGKSGQDVPPATTEKELTYIPEVIPSDRRHSGQAETEAPVAQQQGSAEESLATKEEALKAKSSENSTPAGTGPEASSVDAGSTHTAQNPILSGQQSLATASTNKPVPVQKTGLTAPEHRQASGRSTSSQTFSSNKRKGTEPDQGSGVSGSGLQKAANKQKTNRKSDEEENHATLNPAGVAAAGQASSQASSTNKRKETGLDQGPGKTNAALQKAANMPTAHRKSGKTGNSALHPESAAQAGQTAMPKKNKVSRLVTQDSSLPGQPSLPIVQTNKPVPAPKTGRKTPEHRQTSGRPAPSQVSSTNKRTATEPDQDSVRTNAALQKAANVPKAHRQSDKKGSPAAHPAGAAQAGQTAMLKKNEVSRLAGRNAKQQEVPAKNNAIKQQERALSKTTPATKPGTGKSGAASEHTQETAKASPKQNSRTAMRIPSPMPHPDSTDLPFISASKELVISTAHGAKAMPGSTLPADTPNQSVPLAIPARQHRKSLKKTTQPTGAAAASGTRNKELQAAAKTETKAIARESRQRAGQGKKQEISERQEQQTKPVEQNEAATGTTEKNPGQAGSENLSPAAKDKTKRPLNMSIGVKAAYENGFQSYTANTFIASVFGEVNLSPKISFIVQPGIKLANTSREYQTANGTYIKAGNVQSTMYYEERDTMKKPTGYRNYAYSQTYDSIVASRRAQKQFTEFELPLMFRYKMNQNLSFLGGMNFTFGKTLKMEGVLQTYSGLVLADTILRHYDSAGIAPPAPAVFTHPGSTPFSSYKDPGATEVINMIRFGYTIGLSYTVRQRLIVDLTLQQNLSRLSDIDDQQIKKLFTQPYIRLSAGYSIFGRRK